LILKLQSPWFEKPKKHGRFLQKLKKHELSWKRITKACNVQI
jgi:hypothetical protein